MKEPTNRQAEVLEFIHRYQARNGYPPVLREISQSFGWHHTAAGCHVNALEKKGMVIRGAGYRQTRLTPEGVRYLHETHNTSKRKIIISEP